jgi:CheY-like chemotaxis protein
MVEAISRRAVPRRTPAGHPPRLLHDVRLLVVDDDPHTREILSVTLEAYGAQVSTAASSAEALRALQTGSPHLLLSDISMPGEDGYGLMRRVRSLPRAQGGSIPAIAITALAAAEDREAALRAGFQGHLAKPLQFAVLLDLITTLLPIARDARAD